MRIAQQANILHTHTYTNIYECAYSDASAHTQKHTYTVTSNFSNLTDMKQSKPHLSFRNNFL